MVIVGGQAWAVKRGRQPARVESSRACTESCARWDPFERPDAARRKGAVMSAEVAGYTLEALVGRGGMAEVYRAVALRGPHAGRTVALKRLLPELARDPEHVALLADEAAVTRRLRHPAIVEVLET